MNSRKNPLVLLVLTIILSFTGCGSPVQETVTTVKNEDSATLLISEDNDTLLSNLDKEIKKMLETLDNIDIVSEKDLILE